MSYILLDNTSATLQIHVCIYLIIGLATTFILIIGSQTTLTPNSVEQPSTTSERRRSFDDKSARGDGYRRITLRCAQGYNDPYGFGLRVVGEFVDETSNNGGSVSSYARVLWLSPGGLAESAGIKVGDKV